MCQRNLTFGILCVLCWIALPASAAIAGELYFPNEKWETVAPADAGWDAKQLDAALDFAMSRNSSGVVVLHRGRIMAERYQELDPASARYRRVLHGKTDAGQAIEDVASVQKSVVSFLVGVAQAKGLVNIDDPVHKHLGAGWSQATRQQEAEISIRHLITMSSGLNERLEYEAPPGEKWRYNTTAYSRSLTVIARASGKSPNELAAQWLTEPIGMKDSQWVERTFVRESPVAANRYGFATTARDLARFGLLVLAEGKWNDQAVLGDRGFLKSSRSPSQKLNPSYGYLWWLNGQESAVRGTMRVKGPLIPTAPDDLFAALGALGRKCYVVPSRDLVVTRLGDTPDSLGKPRFDREFWRLIMAAAPK